MTAFPRGGRASAGPIGLVLVVLLVALAAGWLMSSSTGSSNRLTLIGRITGRVSVASDSGGKVCVTPDGGDADRCAGLYRRPEDPPLVVGQLLSVSVGELRTGPAETIEVFILEPPE